MKLLYKMMFFFIILHVTILMVNSLGVFPKTLYSDEDTRTYDFSNPGDVLVYLFPVMDSKDPDTNLFGAIITGSFIGLASLLAIGATILTKNYAPIVVTLLASSFVPMILRSMDTFKKILYVDSEVMIYLFICFSICITFLIAITFIEMLTHGRSG